MKTGYFDSATAKYYDENGKTAFIKYKSVIAELVKISYRIEQRTIFTEKLRKYAFSLSNRLMKDGSDFGDAKYCVLAKITDRGYEYLNPELLSECDNVIAINDEYGAVADELLSFIKNEAVSRSTPVICCYNPFLQYSIERLILPSAKTAICRSSSFCKVENADRRIHYERFCDMNELGRSKQTLNFNKKIIKELLPNCHQI